MTASALASAMFATGASEGPFPKDKDRTARVTPAAIDGYRLIFEGFTCGRCGGDGRWKGYAQSGCCFACNGAGAKYTKRGSAAATRFRELCEQALSVPVEDLQPGDRVWDQFHGVAAWASVVEVDNNRTPGSFTVGAGGQRFTVPYAGTVYITIDHPAGRYTNHTYAGLAERPATMPRWDAGHVTAIVNEVAAMPGAVLESAGEDG